MDWFLYCDAAKEEMGTSRTETRSWRAYCRTRWVVMLGRLSYARWALLTATSSNRETPSTLLTAPSRFTRTRKSTWWCRRRHWWSNSRRNWPGWRASWRRYTRTQTLAQLLQLHSKRKNSSFKRYRQSLMWKRVQTVLNQKILIEHGPTRHQMRPPQRYMNSISKID